MEKKAFLEVGKRSSSIVLALLVVFLFMPAACFGAVTFKLAHTGTPETSITEVYNKFREIVESKSNGEIKLDLHPGGSLGADIELLQSCKLGSIDIVSTSQGNYGSVSKVFLPLDLPYVIPTMDMWEKLMTGELGEKLKKAVEQQDRFKLIFIMNAGGMRHIMNNRKPVKVPAECKGLKLRAVASPIEQAILKSWNIAPTPITWSETYSALEQGVVDGIHNPYMWTYIARMHEKLKYVTETGATPVIHLCIMNLDKFNSLPPKLQSVLEDAGREGAKLAWKIDDQYTQKAKQEFAKKGIKIHIPNPQEMKQWTDATKGVWDQYAKTFDQTVLKMIRDEVGKK